MTEIPEHLRLRAEDARARAAAGRAGDTSGALGAGSVSGAGSGPFDHLPPPPVTTSPVVDEDPDSDPIATVPQTPASIRIIAGDELITRDEAFSARMRNGAVAIEVVLERLSPTGNLPADLRLEKVRTKRAERMVASIGRNSVRLARATEQAGFSLFRAGNRVGSRVSELARNAVERLSRDVDSDEGTEPRTKLSKRLRDRANQLRERDNASRVEISTDIDGRNSGTSAPEPTGSVELRRGELLSRDELARLICYEDLWGDSKPGLVEAHVKKAESNPQAQAVIDELEKMQEKYGIEHIMEVAETLRAEVIWLLSELGVEMPEHVRSTSWAVWDLAKVSHDYRIASDQQKEEGFISDPLDESLRYTWLVKEDIVSYKLGLEYDNYMREVNGGISVDYTETEDLVIIGSGGRDKDGKLSNAGYRLLGELLKKRFKPPQTTYGV